MSVRKQLVSLLLTGCLAVGAAAPAALAAPEQLQGMSDPKELQAAVSGDFTLVRDVYYVNGVQNGGAEYGYVYD